jgi:hypothetical protein
LFRKNGELRSRATQKRIALCSCLRVNMRYPLEQLASLPDLWSAASYGATTRHELRQLLPFAPTGVPRCKTLGEASDLSVKETLGRGGFPALTKPIGLGRLAETQSSAFGSMPRVPTCGWYGRGFHLVAFDADNGVDPDVGFFRLVLAGLRALGYAPIWGCCQCILQRAR